MSMPFGNVSRKALDLIDTEILFDDARFGSNYSPSGCASMGLQMKLLQFFEDPKQCVFEF
jgi:hypothetical protein